MDDSLKELTLNPGEITTRVTWDTIKALKNNKATDTDQLEAELLKCQEGIVVVELTNLMNKCWQIEAVQDKWQKASSSKFPRTETWLNVEPGEELHFCQSLVNLLCGSPKEAF